ncbi:MAG TPA: cold shock domain-containing protein [Prolixibacteraceae bacterium]
MSTGKIKFYAQEKFYGFVIDDETKQDFYFNGFDLQNQNVESDDKVQFEIEKSKQRPGSFCAVNVRLIESNEKD